MLLRRVERSKEFLKAHYASMTPIEKFATPQLESHKIGPPASPPPLPSASQAPSFVG